MRARASCEIRPPAHTSCGCPTATRIAATMIAPLPTPLPLRPQGQYRDELLCVISVSFFCGCYVGFILKAAIDALLPVPPPRTASAASAAPAAAAAAAANPRASPAPRRPKAQ
jgi:hypothetical protein